MVTLLWRGRDRSLTRQRMRGLDRADPATGLATQAVVREQLRRMTARAQRQEHAYAVLLIDLVNLAEVRHKFGRRAWQELPLRLADRLLANMREVDTVGRLSDTRFVMLMDGPITADTASRLAQQILAQCLRPIRGRPEGWTPRVRMALGVLPRDGQDPRGGARSAGDHAGHRRAGRQPRAVSACVARVGRVARVARRPAHIFQAF